MRFSIFFKLDFEDLLFELCKPAQPSIIITYCTVLLFIDGYTMFIRTYVILIAYLVGLVALFYLSMG